MYDYLSEGKDFFKVLKFLWVWIGKNFCFFVQVVIKLIYDLDFQFYLYNVFKIMVKFYQLFKVCGLIEELILDYIFMVIQKVYFKSDQELSEEESK